MKLTFRFGIPLSLCASILLVCASSFGDEKPRDGRSEARDFWKELSKEDQEKLRGAMRSVWTDPSVLAAREGVKQANDAYQAAVEGAMAKSDPATAALFEEMQAANKGEVHEKMGKPPLVRFGGGKGGPLLFGGPEMEQLSREERARLREVEEKVRESASVSAARAELEAIRKSDAELREKRFVAYREMRRATFEAMTAEDPEIEEILGKLSMPLRGDGERKRPVKGKHKGKSE